MKKKSNLDEMRYLAIRQGFMINRKSFAGLARRLKVSRATVSLVAQGKRGSLRVRRAIARAINSKAEELWTSK